MRKTLLIAAATLAVAITSAKADVYSQNIVGYVNKVLLGGNAYSMISLPLGGTNAVETALTSIQVGDNVFVWTGGGYNAYTYMGPDWDGMGHAWADGDFNGVASPVIPSGRAFFYQNSGTSAITNTFVGNVILSNSISILGGNAYSMLASTAPVAGTLDSAAFNLPLQVGDNVFVWTGGGYNALTYMGPDWDGMGHAWADGDFNGVNSPVIEVGQGFFYQNSGTSTIIWTQNLVVP